MENIADRSMKISRTFNAPNELVWEALTTPEHIKHWWGPEGFTNTIHEMDVTVGGKWAFIMHGPDGTDYNSEFRYLEIVPMKKMVLEQQLQPHFIITIELFDEGDQTRVEWTNVFDNAPTMQEAIRAVKADEGLKQNLQRWESFLKNLQS